MCSGADNPKKVAPISGVYCARCRQFLALASFDGEPVCDLCLFGVAKECDLSGMLRKTRPLPVVGGPVKVVPEEIPARRVERLA